MVTQERNGPATGGRRRREVKSHDVVRGPRTLSCDKAIRELSLEQLELAELADGITIVTHDYTYYSHA